MSTGDPFADDPFADPPPVAAQPEPPTPVETAPPAPAPEPEAPAAPPFIEPESAGTAGIEVEPDLEPSTPPPVVDREGIVQAPAAEVPPPPSEPVPPVEPPQAPPEPQEPAPAPPQPPVAPVESPDVPAAPATTTGGTEASSPNGTTTAAEDAATPPDPNAPKKGHRHYVVLYQTGPSEFTKVDLSKHATNDFIARTVEAAPKEGDPDVVDYFLEARNNDHAYKICFTIMGRPESGVTVLPLPKASWRPRRVAPAPPKPETERLVIT